MVQLSLIEGQSETFKVTADDFGYLLEEIEDWDVTDWSVSGSAVEGVDYTYSYNFSEDAFFVSINIIDDSLVEFTEQIVLTYSGFVKQIGNPQIENISGTALLDIIDNDQPGDGLTPQDIEFGTKVGKSLVDVLSQLNKALIGGVQEFALSDFLDTSGLGGQGDAWGAFVNNLPNSEYYGGIADSLKKFGDLLGALGVAFDGAQLTTGWYNSLRAADGIKDFDGAAQAYYDSIKKLYVDVTDTVFSGALGTLGYGGASALAVVLGAAPLSAALIGVAAGAGAVGLYNQFYRDGLRDGQGAFFESILSPQDLKSIVSPKADGTGGPPLGLNLGTDGNDVLSAGSENEIHFVISGDDAVVASAASLNGDYIIGFSQGDSLTITGLILSSETVSLQAGSTIISYDTDGDGVEDGALTLLGDGAPKTLYLETSNGETTLTAEAADLPMGAAVLALGSMSSDTLAGNSGDDRLASLGDDDVVVGGGGDDILDGGAGTDTAGYGGNQSSYTLQIGAGSTTISDRRPGGDGTDTLIDIELLDFASGTFDLTKFGGPAGLSQAEFESFIELYIAYFNRAPDAIGLNFWGTAYANGTTLSEMAALFADQDETRATYPDGTSNVGFATAVYNNVLGRVPDKDGLDFWVGQLDSGNVSRDQFILEVLGGVQPGSPDRAYLDLKVDIGAYFAVHKGMSDVGNAAAAMALFDGTQAGTDAAVAAIDSYYADALDPDTGEFLMQVVGVLDDPFGLG